MLFPFLILIFVGNVMGGVVSELVTGRIEIGTLDFDNNSVSIGIMETLGGKEAPDVAVLHGSRNARQILRIHRSRGLSGGCWSKYRPNAEC